MLRLGRRIRLTAPELRHLEQITGRKPPLIRSDAELDAFFRSVLAQYGETHPWDVLARLLIEAERLSLLGLLPPGTLRQLARRRA